MSAADYQRLGAAGIVGARTELIRGMVLDKTSKSSLHAWLAQYLTDWLKASTGEGWAVRTEQPLSLADSELEPDVSVVVGSLSDYRSHPPSTAALVIEVAISSEKADREKAAIYGEANVQEYWIVLPEHETIEVHRKPSKGQYQTRTILTRPDAAQPEAFPSIAMPLDQLFLRDN